MQQSPLATPTYLNSPSYLTHTYIPMPSPYINAPASRPLMPVTSFQSPMFSTIRSGTTFHRNQPLTNSNSINTTPTSQDSSGLPSSADSKLGLHSRKHEDLKRFVLPLEVLRLAINSVILAVATQKPQWEARIFLHTINEHKILVSPIQMNMPNLRNRLSFVTCLQPPLKIANNGRRQLIRMICRVCTKMRW